MFNEYDVVWLSFDTEERYAKVYEVTNQTEPSISLAFSLPLLNFIPSKFLM